jgi:hypothetical protein
VYEYTLAGFTDWPDFEFFQNTYTGILAPALQQQAFLAAAREWTSIWTTTLREEAEALAQASSDDEAWSDDGALVKWSEAGTVCQIG